MFGKKKIIGLDIGTSSIKVAELDVSRRSSTLVSFGLAPTPPHSVSNGDVLDAQAVATAIRQLIDEIKSKRTNVSTALWGSTVIVKRISIPRMDEGLIAEQIRWEAEQYIPYDVNEVNLGFEVLKNVSSSPETMDILLVAAVQANVFKTAETVQLAGLECKVLDVGGFALANCFKQNYGDMPGQIVALLNIGASVTNFVILESGEVVFCRDIPVGGMHYTSEIQKTLNISMEEAETLKISASNGGPAPDEVASVLQSVHEVVSDEIGGSADFFLNTSNANQINRCFVTGGGAKVPGLLEQISKTIPCEKLDPFFGVNYKKSIFSDNYIEQIRDFSAVAIGLGMRSIGDS